MKYNTGKIRVRKLDKSEDKRKERHNHRIAAKQLLGGGGILNNFSSVGTTFWFVAQYHKFQARYIGR